jgi:hypothetical protein
MKKAFALCIFAVAASGCATHHKMVEPDRLSRTGLMDDVQESATVERAMTAAAVGRLIDAKVQVRLPTSLAVASLATVGRRCGLRPMGADELAAWRKAVAGIPQVQSVQPLSSVVPGEAGLKLRDLRLAAMKLNCGLLLAYLQGDSAIDNYTNFALLYWTVAGLWLSPGNEYEHRTLLQAVLVDCASGAILGAASGDCRLKEARAAADGKMTEDELAREAPRRALADLERGCQSLLRQLAAVAQPPAPPAEPATPETPPAPPTPETQ